MNKINQDCRLSDAHAPHSWTGRDLPIRSYECSGITEDGSILLAYYKNPLRSDRMTNVTTDLKVSKEFLHALSALRRLGYGEQQMADLLQTMGSDMTPTVSALRQLEFVAVRNIKAPKGVICKRKRPHKTHSFMNLGKPSTCIGVA